MIINHQVMLGDYSRLLTVILSRIFVVIVFITSVKAEIVRSVLSVILSVCLSVCLSVIL